MKDATNLDIYFKDDKALFLIPLYQRKYSWKKKHCQRLYADLMKVHREGLYSHFFGSIVSIKASETENDLLIIDGQQRITTISLMVLAAINAVKNGKMKCDNPEYVTDTYNKFLMSKYRRGVERKIKLRPIDDDMKAYDALFTNDEERFVSAADSGVTSNYLFFYNLISSEENTLAFEDLIESIEKLIIIDICLDSKDNPQLIFESLNSCGKDLEEADKVRNYLLMSANKDDQEKFYYNYWSKIEKNTDGEPTMFIRDYLTIKNKVISSFEELYFDFKQYDEDNNIPREELLRDMLKFSTIYRDAGKGTTESVKINKKLKQLASIGSNVCMPFYLQFFDYAKQNNIGEYVQYEVLDAIENYWARRIICALPSNVMAKSFALLHSDIMRIYNEHEKRKEPINVTYAEILKYILLKKQGTGIFPTDNSIREMFPQREVYKIPSSYKTFLFERMENGNGKEQNDSLAEKIGKGEITIEHIMPQHLSPQWIKDLGDDYVDIKDKYLHTFANLTLTGYNQEYSNRKYSEKWEGYTVKRKNKETKKDEEIEVIGYKDSPFKLSSYMKTHLAWTETELKERGELLLKQFLKLWPMIKTDYVPLEREVEVVAFDDDDIEFTGRKIAGYRYRGQSHKVITWKDMLVEVCTSLYHEKPTEMLFLATKEWWLHEAGSRERTKIADRCYVHSSNSTYTKKSILNYIFKELNISPSILEIELLPLNEEINDNEEE